MLCEAVRMEKYICFLETVQNGKRMGAIRYP